MNKPKTLNTPSTTIIVDWTKRFQEVKEEVEKILDTTNLRWSSKWGKYYVTKREWK